ncbi:MAG: Asp-tRNA(Asn)/Glu-tRNA(Gln) amidotransferase subunit GatB [Patescibacteria group bacterium]|jgi:aspartyl-tRNA(Asn)/glutamyl-tRNA(Gln) amidotransferase subunit B
MENLHTKIGLEIHVQLKTKSKMFCRCDNDAQGKTPNSVVCPVCLGLPGALPVANEQAIEWTIKTGLALNCQIPKIAKFDRKHYFYPDLPKGYQISQYDEPFCVGGMVEVDGQEIRLNRIHLEEDAGKLIHSGNKSLVDLNRAGTPLMEIVTEPDIASPEMAGNFLRKLQKIVRDVVSVSEASMEKGHMRCDANISVSDENGRMSQIIELKNLNSFKFVEKALTLVDAKLKEEYPAWPEKNSKETWGYDSEKNSVCLQRRKEEAADYRYFPEPDLPPFDSSAFDHDKLRNETKETAEEKLEKLEGLGVSGQYASKLLDHDRYALTLKMIEEVGRDSANEVGRIVADYIDDAEEASKHIDEFVSLIKSENNFQKQILTRLAEQILSGKTFAEAESEISSGMIDQTEIESVISSIVANHPDELNRYKAGEQQLFGFFMGQIMKETKGKVNPAEINKILKEKL